jgi:putative ABC transport system permease protein
MYPYSAIRSVLGPEYDGLSHRMYFTSSDHSSTYQAMKKILEEGSNNDVENNLKDYASKVEEERNTVTVIRVFAYGFIVLISLIALANVFNTISTNIALRRREFAMLRSVGMTSKGFNKMMNFECILYGIRSLMAGLPVSVGVTYLIYKVVNSGYSTDFHMSWLSIGVAVFSVFAVVFATMMYAMGRIKKDNPIDALRNENL